jgi:hypothetical protein
VCIFQSDPCANCAKDPQEFAGSRQPASSQCRPRPSPDTACNADREWEGHKGEPHDGEQSRVGGHHCRVAQVTRQSCGHVKGLLGHGRGGGGGSACSEQLQ